MDQRNKVIEVLLCFEDVPIVKILRNVIWHFRCSRSGITRLQSLLFDVKEAKLFETMVE